MLGRPRAGPGPFVRRYDIRDFQCSRLSIGHTWPLAVTTKKCAGGGSCGHRPAAEERVDFQTKPEQAIGSGSGKVRSNSLWQRRHSFRRFDFLIGKFLVSLLTHSDLQLWGNICGGKCRSCPICSFRDQIMNFVCFISSFDQPSGDRGPGSGSIS